MNSKAIRKQLLAAVAMVLVAAVALGSSTYAWFVSNNTVKATTSTISAQSNAPFLMIDKTSISESSTTAISYATDADVALYPAQVVKNNDNTPLFKSAYASNAGAATELANSRYDVGNVEAAVTGKFAIKESFKIGTADLKAGSFKDLKVAAVELTSAGTNGLEDALSVLVVCGDQWAVYKKSADGTVLTAYKDSVSAVGNNTAGVLAAAIKAGSSEAVTVDVYVFYDGSETNVYTNNLSNLTAIGATITFTATPVNTQGADVTAPNAVPAAVATFANNTLSVNVQNAPADYTATYSWAKDGVAVPSATAETYSLTASDQDGSYICTVTYTKVDSPTITVVSNAIAATYVAP